MPADLAAADLPAPVRAAVLGWAAEVLGSMPPRQVPSALVAVRRFAPRRRVSAGAGPLWAAVDGDEVFRARVGRAWTLAHPDAAARVLGVVPGAAGSRPGDAAHGSTEAGTAVTGPDEPRDPRPEPFDLDLAIGAVLLRPDGWQRVVTRQQGQPVRPGDDGTTAPDPDPALAARLSAAEEHARDLAARLLVEMERADAAEQQVAALTKEQRRLRSDADRARSEARRSAEHAREVAEAAERVHTEAAAVHQQARRAQDQADDLVAAARADAATLRDLAEVRVRLLLDTVVEAGTALRTELALPPVATAPADLVAPGTPATAVHAGSRGRSAQDPALLDELLALPRAHLVVDGYNVSKLAWPERTLAEQRQRLVERLGTLAARTGAEVTCCFDGVEGPSAGRAVPAPRRVRVLFSQGEIADDLIRRIVRAEPTGRVVVAVTTDRALGADLEAAGARVLPSATLVGRFGRV